MAPDLQSDVLVLGCAGEVSFLAVTGLAIRKYAANRPLAEVLETSLAAAGSLVEGGLCDIGVLEGGDFVPMTGQIDDLLQGAREHFDGTVDGEWRHEFWLRNTAAGDAHVAALAEDYNPFEDDWRR